MHKEANAGVEVWKVCGDGLPRLCKSSSSATEDSNVFRPAREAMSLTILYYSSRFENIACP
jgi:hypothetical protein